MRKELKKTYDEIQALKELITLKLNGPRRIFLTMLLDLCIICKSANPVVTKTYRLFHGNELSKQKSKSIARKNALRKPRHAKFPETNDVYLNQTKSSNLILSQALSCWKRDLLTYLHPCTIFIQESVKDSSL